MSGKIFLLQENEKLQALSAKDYESEALLQELDVAISDNEIDKYPSIPLAVLTDEAKLQQFLAVFVWFLQGVKAT